jgi:Tetratricopeptide repeat
LLRVDGYVTLGPVTGDLARAADLIAAWDYAGAHPLLVQLYEAAVAAGREDHLDTLTVRRMLAEALRELGYLEEARDLAGRAVRACRERYGDRHPATVRALAGLGMVLHSQGELADARQCFEQAIASGVSAERPAGRAVLLARAQLALVTRDEGDPGSAVRQLTAAYGLHRRTFGGGDLETIRLAAELGRLYSVLGDEPAARRQLAVAHAGAYAQLGEDHPLTGFIEAALREVEAPMPSAPVSAPVGRAPRRRLRMLAGVAGALGTLLVASGAVVAVAAGTGPSGTAPAGPAPAVVAPALSVTRPTSAPPSPARSGTRGAPRNVTLHDDGTSITVSWTDPTDGTGSVLLALARAGQPAGPLRSLPPGTHEDRITGLDPTVDYCVVLAVAYPQDPVAPAAQVCTHRGRKG